MRRTAFIFSAFCATLFLAATAASAQAVKFGVDGNWWVAAGRGDADAASRERLALVRGIYDGIEFGGARDAYAYPTDAPFTTLVAGLDSFYTDELNRPILVAFALRILDLRL